MFTNFVHPQKKNFVKRNPIVLVESLQFMSSRRGTGRVDIVPVESRQCPRVELVMGQSSRMRSMRHIDRLMRTGWIYTFIWFKSEKWKVGYGLNSPLVKKYFLGFVGICLERMFLGLLKKRMFLGKFGIYFLGSQKVKINK